MPLPRFLQRKTPTPADTPELADGESPEVQEARTRARRRLMGAVVLLGAGVIVFPLLFESQPRTAATEVPMDVARKPQTSAATRATTSPPTSKPVVVAQAASTAAQEPARADSGANADAAASTPSSPLQTVPTQTVPAQVAEASVAMAPAPASAPALAPQPTSVPPLALKASAVDAAPTGGRYVVQVGAFTDMVALREARQKVEKLGLKTYIQVIETPTGNRTRVRVGPFETRDDANRAATKLKGAAMPAFILAL